MYILDESIGDVGERDQLIAVNQMPHTQRIPITQIELLVAL